MKKASLFLLIILITLTGYSQSVTTSNFKSKLPGLIDNPGQTITFAAGTYTVNRTELNTLFTNNTASNVTFRPHSGTVNIVCSYRTISDMTFNNKNGIKLQNLTLKNIKVEFNNCTNSKISTVKFRGGKVSTSDFTSAQVSQSQSKKVTWNYVALVDGANNTVENSNLKWQLNKPKKRGKGIKVNGGTNHKLLNNKIWGYMVNGVAIITGKKQDNNVTAKTEHLIQGGEIIRDASNPDEDHGLYIHNITHVTVDGVKFTNWSKTGAGHGIKLKGVKKVTVKNCTFTKGGIIIREATNWGSINHNIYIYKNTFEQFGINGFGLNGRPSMYGSCRIESNKIRGNASDDVSISFPNETTVFNSSNSQAPLYSNGNKRPGGVHSNCTTKNRVLDSDIYKTNNSSGSCSGSAKSTLSDKTIDLENNFNVFPNPFKNNFTINLGNTHNVSQVQLFDLNGKSILNRKVKGSETVIEINLTKHSISKGIYFLKIIEEGNVKNIKILKD